MTLDLAALRLLAQAATQPGPWTVLCEPQGKGRHSYRVLDANGMWVAEFDDAEHDAAFVAAANPTAILALLDRCERAEAEVERLTVNRDHSCTCPHGDAREPLVNHDKACPIRVNKLKRIAPEVALSRLAAALDTGDELDEVTAERDALRAECERLRGAFSRIKDEVRYAVNSASEAVRDAMIVACGRAPSACFCGHHLSQTDAIDTARKEPK